MPKTVYLRDFPDDLHREVKIQAAKEETTMKEIIIRLLTEYIQKAKKKEAKGVK